MYSLYQTLQTAKTEEDVKTAYIKALGLKDYSLNLIDIQTKEMRFEAKIGGKISTYSMFTQLLHYVQHNLDRGAELPPFLCVIDCEKAAIMRTADALPLLQKKTIKRGKSASDVTQDALDQVSAYIGTYVVSFKIETHEEEFISTVKSAIASGDIIRTQITPDNLKQVFDKWIDMIGKEIRDVSQDDFSLLFFADIMNDGTVSTHENLPAQLLHKNNAPAFELNGRVYELGNKEGYRRFWAIYDRPPKAEYRNYLLERRDSLIPVDERSFKGAYYTPLHVVDKAYDKLAETLGKNRQKEYIVRDMCCGVGNLEVKHSNHRNLYMSTLDQADVDVMKATKTCVGAVRFQYDYLNDDITDDGQIDYNLTKKIPDGLRRAISEGKNILILINPPYAEAMNSDNISDNANAESKKGVQKTKVAECIDVDGYAKRELFVQFLVRIAKEIPTATLAMFSTLKYVNAPNFEGFREKWKAKYLGGFIVHSKSFDGLNGNFPIGFLVWNTKNNSQEKTQIMEISTEILDKDAKPIGEKKFYNIPNDILLSNWVDRVKSNDTDSIPLKNAISPTTNTKDVRGKKRADGAIGNMICKGSDLQNASTQTALLSSGYCSAGAFFVTPENLRQASVIFTVRRIVKPTWINDRDQFLQPSKELSDEFKSDCLIWMLFNGSNLTASANDLQRNNKKRSIINHFIPYTEQEVGADERFESDFLVRYMEEMPDLIPTFSGEERENDLIPDPSPKRRRVSFGCRNDKDREYVWIDPVVLNNAKDLRKNQTAAEEIFWYICRDRQIAGLKFRRQHPIGRYIVDFFCKEAELVIELDGSIHNLQHIKVADTVRQKELELQGKTVLRFTNDEIYNNIETVIKTIITHPNISPLLSGEGQGERSNISETKDMTSSPTLLLGGEGSNRFSPEAQAVLEAGKVLWRKYFEHTDPHTIRDELKLNRPDVGWYQIRNALKKRNESGDVAPVSFVEFENAYKVLTEKIRPMVRELGFLR